jgi:hypothetical protein
MDGGASKRRRIEQVAKPLLLALIVLSSCSARSSGRAATSPVAPPSTTDTLAADGDSLEVLAALVVDDNPAHGRPYLRDDWPTWEDIDGDGCDAREQTLIAESTTPAQVDPFGCKVIAGDWTSDYDGTVTSDPSAVDIDHVVPLENAHLSGGWRWDAGRRRQFANDPANLVAVSPASNRSKGASTPDEWRPPNQVSWCQTATTWVRVKVSYGLTATTTERDALGDMLSRCGGPTAPSNGDTATMSTPITITANSSEPFPDCAEARMAGAAPMQRGSPGYSDRLDGDSDGIACE